MGYNRGANVMSKKIKIPFSEVASLDYHKFAKGVCNGVKGYFYFLDHITEINRQRVEKYSNTKILQSRCEFAPEIKKVVIFVGNKCF